MAPTPPPKPPQKKRNTFAYVKALLWRNRKSDFTSYKDPELTAAAKDLYQKCKALGGDCNDEFILTEYDNSKQEPYPEEAVKILQDALAFETQEYFTIDTVPFLLVGKAAPTVWFTSTMIMPPPHAFLVTTYYNEAGDTTEGFQTWFKAWVDWCNEYVLDTFGELESGKIFFKVLPPTYDKTAFQRRWQFEIIICTIDGDRESYGFSPSLSPVGEGVKPVPLSPGLTGEGKGRGEIKPPQLPPGSEDLIKQIQQLQSDLKKQREIDKDAAIKNKMHESILKDRELKRLKTIKKELEKTLKLYMDLSEKHGIDNKQKIKDIIVELDQILEKIKKLG